MYKIVDAEYVKVPKCHKVICLCGEEYTQHEIEHQRRCKDHNTVPMEDLGLLVVVHRGADGNVAHRIKCCPICKGLDLANWRSGEALLTQFNKGEKEIHM